MLATEVYIHELTTLFQRFCVVVGEDLWLKRVKLIESEIRGVSFLKSYLKQENHFAFSLSELSKLNKDHGIIPRSHTRNKNYYPVLAFMKQTLSLLDGLSDSQKKALLGRLRGSFANPDDLRGFTFELSVAFQFVKKGKNVTWPETGVDASPDFIVNDLGFNGLEVECKSISQDKGRKIRQRESLEFFNLIKSDINTYLRDKADAGITCLVINVPGKLPKGNERKHLAEHVRNATNNNMSLKYDGSIELKLTHFGEADLDNLLSQQQNNKAFRELVDQISGTQNCQSMLQVSKNKSMLVVLQSNSEDTLLKETFNTLSDSSKRQFSKNRAAVYMVEFDALSPDEIQALAHHDFDESNEPSGLRLAVDKFLSSENRPFIVGVNFISNGSVMQIEEGHYTERRATYYFSVEESKFWHNDFATLLLEK